MVDLILLILLYSFARYRVVQLLDYRHKSVSGKSMFVGLKFLLINALPFNYMVSFINEIEFNEIFTQKIFFLMELSFLLAVLVHNHIDLDRKRLPLSFGKQNCHQNFCLRRK